MPLVAALVLTIAIVVGVVAFTVLWAPGTRGPARAVSEAPATISLTSPAFANGSAIPVRYTCDGEDVSPPLRWSGVPSGAETLAIVVVDPDAPGGTFIHWVIYNVPPNLTGLPEAIPNSPRTRFGLQARNDFGEFGWGGPCPPRGDRPHRYVFTIYALREPVEAPPDADARRIIAEIESRAIARGVLVGLYSR